MRRLVPLVLLLAACGGTGTGAGSDPNASTPTGPGTSVGTTAGRLMVGMTASRSESGPIDADGLTRIVVHVAQVRIHRAGSGWETISSATVSVDLLQIQSSSAALGLAEIDTSSVGQIRLVLEDGSNAYVTTPDGEMHPLDTPSGQQSGLKLKGPFNVTPCADTTVLADVDLGKSIHVVKKGRQDQYVLRPVIRTITSTQARDGCGDDDDGDGDGDGDDLGF